MTQAKPAKKKNGSKLFFLNGRLKWGGIPIKWEKPQDDTKFEEQVGRADFFTQEDLRAVKLDQSPTFTQDLADLKTHLLVPYFESSQKAKHFQNDYFRQQWILAIGAFLTALVTTLVFALSPVQTVLAPLEATAQTAEGEAGTPADSALVDEVAAAQALPSTSEARFAAILTAVITFITTVVTAWARQQRAQYYWYLWRTVTEELRRHYFLYLSHLPPYNTADAVERLELNVPRILDQKYTDGDASGASSPGIPARMDGAADEPRPPHTEEDYGKFIYLYQQKRVDGQLKFYGDRVEEYDANAGFVSLTTVVLIALSTLLSAVNIVIGQPWIILIIGLLPIMGALLVSFEKIYGWERQKVLYEDALGRLRIDRTIPPVQGRIPKRPYADINIEFVSAVEATLRAEMSQWGQAVLKDGSSFAALSAEEALEMALTKGAIPAQQADVIRKAWNEKPE
jgi:hypothetical protein